MSYCLVAAQRLSQSFQSMGSLSQPWSAVTLFRLYSRHSGNSLSMQQIARATMLVDHIPEALACQGWRVGVSGISAERSEVS